MAFRNNIRCFLCDFAGTPRVMKKLDGLDNNIKQQIAARFRQNLRMPFQVVGNDSRLCINCYRLVTSEIEMQNDPTCIQLNVLKQTDNKTCLICNENNILHKLSSSARAEVFMIANIYIGNTARCCQHHLTDDGHLIKALLPGLQYLNRFYKLTGHELQNFLSKLREVSTEKGSLIISPNKLSDIDFKLCTSVTKQNFQELLNYCDSLVVPLGRRYVHEKDLLAFLCKLRQGLSDDFLKVIFNYNSRQAASLAISTVRQSLMLRFVPQNIGLTAITRQEYINRHVTEFANALYNPNVENPTVIACIDGTYCYMEKSSNFQALRQSYNLHKGRHLIKPALIVAPDGYILDIHGPYFADSKNNDAAMLQNQFETDAGALREWLGEDVIFIVDRGYRDVLPLLENLGIDHKMPPFLELGQKQLETAQANDSRLITKSRWIIEARNGHIKSIFKFFKNTISVVHAIHLREFYLIAGALINRYRENIHMAGATAELAQQMLERAQAENTLRLRVEREFLGRRNAMWNLLNENHVLDFPRLDIDYLKDLTVGIYQIHLAPAYIQDKLLRDGSEVFEFDEHRDEDGFLRVRLYSRFKNRTKYQLWITYNHNEDPNNKPITGYYCTCSSGSRTLGCCAHVASVIWFLGYARHQPNIKYPSTRLLDNIRDAGNRHNQDQEMDEEHI